MFLEVVVDGRWEGLVLVQFKRVHRKGNQFWEAERTWLIEQCDGDDDDR